MRTILTILDNWLKIVLSLAISIPFILFPSFTFAQPTLTIQLHGELILFKDSPFIENDRTIVPVREMAHHLGAEVSWNPLEKTVTLRKKQSTVTLVKGVQLIGDKAFAPLRSIAEGLQDRVEWDPVDRLVTVHPTEKLTTKQAEDLVRKKLHIPKNADTIVEFDFELEAGIYAIHVYKVVDDHTATIGWYQVDATTRTVESLF